MKKPLRIIFLDIDGVLNNQGCFEGQQLDPIDPNALKLLNRLVIDTDACIVISSSWRIGNTLHWLQIMLEKAGFDFPERIIGATIEIIGRNKTRGQEIAMWLDQVSVDSFVILDDDDDMEPVQDRLIQTTFEHGLLQEHIDKARDMLLNETT